MKLKNYFKDKDERNLLANIGLAFAVKGVSLFISLFSMPLYIKYFNNDEVLGVWYTILSLLHWITICDLGLGNGLRNRLTESLAVGDNEKAKKSISSTYAALIVVIIPISIIGMILLNFADLNSFFNIDNTLISRETMRIAVIILFLGVCLSFVLKTINSIIYAVQKSSLNNVLTLITSVIPLVYIFLFQGDNMEANLIALTVVHVIASNIPLLVSSFVLFKSKLLRECAPSFKCCDISTAKSMLGFGVQFFLAQIFFMILTNTNEILIAKMFSASDVVDYSIYNRLFTVVGSLFMLALTPLWSKVTKDLAQKKYQKIRRTNHFLYVLSALAFAGEFVLVLCCQFVVDIWLGEEAIMVSYPTAIIFAFYGGMYIFNVVLTTVANGMADLKTQIVFYGIGSVLKIPIIYLMSLEFDNWNIVMLYNGIVFLIFCLFQLVWIERKVKKLIADSPHDLDNSCP
ncbi:MAG: MATE family efflux transporter [Clostridia bacterium]|nr:MATE family efflux transporter [Clostridia bacterium]